jgi:rubrerythrin
VVEHRAPEDDLREPYNRALAAPLTKINALTIVGGEHQTRDYYMNVGPVFADPVARQLYAEIASIEEQHVTQYESIIDPDESLLEKWLLHEATEVYNYYNCLQQESNPRVKEIWERFLAYELGHLHYVMDIFKSVEKRDPAEILPLEMPEPIKFSSQRDYVRKVLAAEVNIRAAGTSFVPKEQESQASLEYRARINSAGSPSETVAAGYKWGPGTEGAKRAMAVAGAKKVGA